MNKKLCKRLGKLSFPELMFADLDNDQLFFRFIDIGQQKDICNNKKKFIMTKFTFGHAS